MSMVSDRIVTSLWRFRSLMQRSQALMKCNASTQSTRTASGHSASCLRTELFEWEKRIKNEIASSESFITRVPFIDSLVGCGLKAQFTWSIIILYIIIITIIIINIFILLLFYNHYKITIIIIILSEFLFSLKCTVPYGVPLISLSLIKLSLCVWPCRIS